MGTVIQFSRKKQQLSVSEVQTLPSDRGDPYVDEIAEHCKMTPEQTARLETLYK